MAEKPQFHGSDLELIEQYYGISKERIISFSGNINPLGISPLFRKSLITNIDKIMAYPDREYVRLREAISRYCECSYVQILVGSGVTELFSRFIREIRPNKTLLINPAYSEYAREIHLAGGLVTSLSLDPAQDFRLDVNALCSMLDETYNLLIICNPNNPTGTAVHHKELRQIFDHCRSYHIHVLIDETYVEFTSDIRDITSVPLVNEFSNICVLRGVSKFFAAPGIRLGYAITNNSELLGRINDSKNPWGINSLAAASAPSMFADTEYIVKTKTYIKKERERLVGILQKEENLQVFQPSANFILLQLRKDDVTASDVFEHAIKDGLMLRDCSSFPGLFSGFIRFSFRTPEDNDRLIKKIVELL